MIRPDEILFSNRKTISISVDFFGKVTVRAPRRCAMQKILAFVQEKEEWILRRKAQTEGAGVRLPPQNLHGYPLLLLGVPCPITLDNGRSVRYQKTEDGHALFVPEKDAQKRLTQWLKTNAKRIFTQVAAEWAETMGVRFQSVTVTSAKTRWGSCSQTNALRFTFRLLYAPKDVIEYVVVHELSHIRHKNHSKAFWAEVATYVPDWKSRRAWLKTHGGLMEVF